MAKPKPALLGALKPYASITDHPRAVIDGRVASATFRKERYLDKLADDPAALAVLNDLVHVDFSGTRCDGTEAALWQKLHMVRGRCLEGVHAWCFVDHATGPWLERITEMRNFGFNSSGDTAVATAMLATLRRKLPALEVLECCGIPARDAEILDDVFAGASTRVICELRFREVPSRPLAIEVRQPDALDRSWLDRMLAAPT